jgi:hypothetical protein
MRGAAYEDSHLLQQEEESEAAEEGRGGAQRATHLGYVPKSS